MLLLIDLLQFKVDARGGVHIGQLGGLGQFASGPVEVPTCLQELQHSWRLGSSRCHMWVLENGNVRQVVVRRLVKI